MVNYNGKLIDKLDSDLLNRGFLYGDSVFETIKIVNNRILFWEDHYLRLMSSLRIIRIEIPVFYTPEFFENQIIKTFSKLSNSFCGRVRLSFFREGSGLYTPESMNPSFIIHCSVNENTLFVAKYENYKVDLFKDYYLNDNLLSNLKTNNKIINVLAGVYAKENNLSNCILLNNKKMLWNF